jgi:GH35 family endo-1,4-beta-xylanase
MVTRSTAWKGLLMVGLALIRKLKDQGISVAAVGLQDHDSLQSPKIENEDAAIAAFRGAGIR